MHYYDKEKVSFKMDGEDVRKKLNWVEINYAFIEIDIKWKNKR